MSLIVKIGLPICFSTISTVRLGKEISLAETLKVLIMIRSRQLLFVLTLLCLVTFAGFGCSGNGAEPGDVEEQNHDFDGDGEDENQEDPVERVIVASGPLEVGFARVEMPWRVGAKPGQVGSAALPGLDVAFLTLLQPILSIVRSNRGPAYILEEATKWLIKVYEEEMANTNPEEYAKLFEPGQGLEEPPDVKALVIRRGEMKVAVVRADLYLMHEYIHRHVAELVFEETGLTREEIFLTATHNHSAPHPSFPAPGVWSLADGFDPRHYVYVVEKIAKAIIEADQALQPARMRAKRSHFDEVQFNIIGSREESLINPDGEEELVQVGYPRDHFDSDLDLIYFDSATAPHDPIGLVFVFGMHPETLPDNHRLVSGEFPIHVEKHIEAAAGLKAMWIPGPLGDIEPDREANNLNHYFWRSSFEGLHQMSTLTASAVLERLEELRADSDLFAEKEPLFLNRFREIPGTADFPLPTSAYLGGFRLKTPRVLHGSTLIALHSIRLGDVLLMGFPAETVTDLSWNFKSRAGLGRSGEAVHQGYHFAENPDWVGDRIAANFGTWGLDEQLRAPIPVVVNLVNGYMGYVVTRWEYENREHYRQQMTSHGPETADHLVSHALKLVEEMMGGAPLELEYPQWIDVDKEGVETIMEVLRQFPSQVATLQEALGADEVEAIGTVVAQPFWLDASQIDARQASFSPLAFQWVGGSNHGPPPQVFVEVQGEEGWEPLLAGPSMSIHLFYKGDQVWEARWFLPYTYVEIPEESSLRFRVKGKYVGAPGGSSTDPVWDPQGRLTPYDVSSESFSLEEIL